MVRAYGDDPASAEASGLFVLATAVWWTTRRSASVEAGERTRAATSRSALVVRVAAVVLSVVVAAGAVVDVYRIGDSGASAVWGRRLRTQQTGPGSTGELSVAPAPGSGRVSPG